MTSLAANERHQRQGSEDGQDRHHARPPAVGLRPVVRRLPPPHQGPGKARQHEDIDDDTDSGQRPAHTENRLRDRPVRIEHRLLHRGDPVCCGVSAGRPFSGVPPFR